MNNHDQYNKCNDTDCCGGDDICDGSCDPRVKEAVDEVMAEMDAVAERMLAEDGQTISAMSPEMFEKGRSSDTPTTVAGRGVERVTDRINKKDGSKLGRNDLCPCDSGKKLKKCCWDLLNG